MNRACLRRFVIVGLALVAGASLAAQDKAPARVVVRPADLQFAAMPNGTFQADVVGSAAAPGPYAARVRIPGGLRLPPHFHPEARIVVVLSGTLYLGYGDTFDESKMTALPPGSVFTEAAKEAHYTWAKDGGVVLHVTGVGPTATTWLDGKK
jgi:quercetin dioxygenase-like cupin family protein